MDAGPPRILPVGDRAVLVELPGLQEVLSVQAQLEAEPSAGQVDVVAAARTVLVIADSPRRAAAIAARLRGMDFSVQAAVDEILVGIDVVYDGADLDEVARHTGLSRQGVVDAHTSQLWTAAFGGFAPGFAYLVGGDRRLDVPRRESPRTAVPAGAVALAGEYSAVYPRESPGGWQLIGRTGTALWDLEREPPALIQPGNRVRFSAVREVLSVGAGVGAGSVKAPAPPGPAARAQGHGVVAVETGLQSIFQDAGRPGFASLGVAESGALDRGSYRQANRLVGNPPGTAVIESVFGGLVLAARTDQVLAVTGARVPLLIEGSDGTERRAATHAPFALRAGETVRMGFPSEGLRSYTAVRGGWEAAPALGSRSTDILSGLGPPPLARGGFLRVGPASEGMSVGNPELPAALPREAVLRFVPGPRIDWFPEGGLEQLSDTRWTVSPASNRVGLRLEGPPLGRLDRGELPSEGTVRGALQVPPSGLPVLFLADHPVTGGYPVIGVVIAEDLDQAAQLPPGAGVRFVASPGNAPVAAV